MERKSIKYPIGSQTFSDIIEENYLYVDKTALLYKLANEMPKYLFLSRPRRFGKSLLLSTLKCYFEGRKDLFKGLAIEELEKNWFSYPVIHISLAGFKGNSPKNLRDYLRSEFNRVENLFEVSSNSQNLGSHLKDLIANCYDKYGKKVVVLIDEYDNPLLCVIHDDAKRKAIQTVATELYGTLKDCDPWLKLVFITGITKFSQLSIFSTLNNITNISLRDEFATICGFTKEELNTCLAPGITALAEKIHLSYDDTVKCLTEQYDGYRFSEECEDIYNPYSLMKCFESKKIKDYWFETATPSYLIEVLKKYSILPSQIGKVQASESDFDTPTESMNSWIPLFYQCGYLTIKAYNPISKLFTLDIPNNEVRVGLMGSLLPNYVKNPVLAKTIIGNFMECFYKNNLDAAFALLSDFFETIPYCNDTDYEGHWQQLLYVVFSLIGAYADVEVHTKKGRVDMAMIFMNNLYIFEVKINGTAKEAINQINQKEYSKRFQNLSLPLIKIGISFNTTKRSINDIIIQP